MTTEEPAKLGIREARARLPEVTQRAENGERFVLTNHGIDRCAIVPMADLARLEASDARNKARKRPQ